MAAELPLWMDGALDIEYYTPDVLTPAIEASLYHLGIVGIAIFRIGPDYASLTGPLDKPR